MRQISKQITRKQFEKLIKYYPKYTVSKGMVFTVAPDRFMRSNGVSMNYIEYITRDRKELKMGCIQTELETKQLKISDFPSQIEYHSVLYERRFLITNKDHKVILCETSGTEPTDTVKYTVSFRGENCPWETVIAKILQ